MKKLAALALVVGILGWAAGAAIAAAPALAPAEPPADAPQYTYSLPAAELGKAKVPGLVPALRLTPKDFADFGPASGAVTKEEYWKDEIIYHTAAGHIEVHRWVSAVSAQRRFQAGIDGQWGGTLMRVLSGPLADLGDVRAVEVFHGTDLKEQLSTGIVMFTRNNIQVIMSRTDNNGPDVVALARRIDQQILGWVEAPKGAPPAAAPAAEELGKVKVPGLVPALKFNPKDFADLGPAKDLTEENLWKDRFSFRAGKGPVVEVEVYRWTSSAVAQKRLAVPLESRGSATPRVVSAGPLADLGDLCVSGGNDAKEQLAARNIQFTRNNVTVTVGCSGDGVDVPALARRIDKQILSWVEATKDAAPAETRPKEAAPAAAPPAPAAGAGPLRSRSFTAGEVGKVKVPGLVPALHFGPKDYADVDLSRDIAPDEHLRDAVVFRGLEGMRIEVSRWESAEAVQKDLKSRLDYQGTGDYWRVLKGPLADVGDVCLVTIPKGEEEKEQTWPHFIQFARNNVRVTITCGPRDPAPEAVARRIDKQILAWVEAPKDAAPKETAPQVAAPAQ